MNDRAPTISQLGPTTELPPQIVLYHLATGHYLSLLKDGSRHAAESSSTSHTPHSAPRSTRACAR